MTLKNFFFLFISQVSGDALFKTPLFSRDKQRVLLVNKIYTKQNYVSVE